MSNMLKNALEEQRTYYFQKLLAIGVYNNAVLNKMTVTELKNEYNYFYHNIWNEKKKKTK
ncbi:Fur-regulated basic protein FbpA [Metabacillus sp. GX 13764]|uniref:Fur-regulated basic protein FbpA n=1 Tax=Metabacillus kandeliae TaxID=2900151 RepID=UPI001E343620|nr:Fur-regulated basic protein FbpA [Metabacillus kandeliae]MCD7036198.1 Fur-regulated basic protein FbpA [Metabacillus kandeliae]